MGNTFQTSDTPNYAELCERLRKFEPDEPEGVLCRWALKAIEALLAREAALIERYRWHEGCPPHPYDKEWFIALTTYGDRVVLMALPDEYSYDYKTANETYLMKDKVARWMQFPDSEFVPVTADALIAELARSKT